MILNATLPLTSEQIALFDELADPSHKELLIEAVNNAPDGSLLNLFQMHDNKYASAIITTDGISTLIFG
jgi:hypothetical protein